MYRNITITKEDITKANLAVAEAKEKDPEGYKVFAICVFAMKLSEEFGREVVVGNRSAGFTHEGKFRAFPLDYRIERAIRDFDEGKLQPGVYPIITPGYIDDIVNPVEKTLPEQEP